MKLIFKKNYEIGFLFCRCSHASILQGAKKYVQNQEKGNFVICGICLKLTVKDQNDSKLFYGKVPIT